LCSFGHPRICSPLEIQILFWSASQLKKFELFFEEPSARVCRACINREEAITKHDKKKKRKTTTTSPRRQQQNHYRKKRKAHKPQKEWLTNDTLHAKEHKRCKLVGGVGFPQQCLQGGERHPWMSSKPNGEPRFFNPTPRG
jgi:hypothetical protein